MRLFIDMDGTLAELREDTAKTFMKPGYFLRLRPYQSLITTLKRIRKARPDVEMFVLTTVHTVRAIQEKERWLNRFFPEIDVLHRIYATSDKPKGHFIPGGVQPTDVLIDDHTPNLLAWQGIAIKAVNPLNHRGGKWRGPCLKVDQADPLYMAISNTKHMRQKCLV